MLKKIFAYILIGVILTVTPLYYINNIILGDEKITTNKVNSYKSFFMSFKKSGTKIPDTAKNVAVTYDGSYITYIDSEVLYIKNSKDDKLYDIIKDDEPIIYSLPLNDRNIIMYFTYDGKNLAIKTYDIDNQEITEHKSFKASNLKKICDVRYSSYTNLIYICSQTKSYGIYKNNIYRVDIMKNISLYAKGKEIENIGLLNNKDTLVYEDKNSRIHIKSKIFKYDGNSKFKFLGIDDEDNIYLLSLEDEKTILVVNDGDVIEKRYLDDSSFDSIFNRDNKVCLVYKDYIYDVIQNKKIDIKSGITVIDISDSHIVYKNSNNNIVVDKI
ncbi:hypothetical protein FDN13_11135 [Caloramator sp. E03]|uniref:hypothetical protein n=1 Tax=Caloramator sp. E03 TaxID=2576307 RepID=UPI001110EE04|nr:hypothetical protein [Caloramator sp. E03]QCX34208.1 hypothetical protein FDN13_11135 [Caloramator sp. E03]